MRTFIDSLIKELIFDFFLIMWVFALTSGVSEIYLRSLDTGNVLIQHEPLREAFGVMFFTLVAVSAIVVLVWRVFVTAIYLVWKYATGRYEVNNV